VKKRRRLGGVAELVISLAARGLTTGEIAAHFVDVYGGEVSRDPISRITARHTDKRPQLGRLTSALPGDENRFDPRRVHPCTEPGRETRVERPSQVTYNGASRL
jgi:hypothetical protein